MMHHSDVFLVVRKLVQRIESLQTCTCLHLTQYGDAIQATDFVLDMFGDNY